MSNNNEYIFHDDFVEYKSYDLFFSSLHKAGIVSLDRINAIDLKTFPHSLIIDNREIIFLNHNDLTSLEPFALKNNIPHSKHFDTWAILTRDYLDAIHEEKIVNEQNQQLKSIGIDKQMFEKITKQIRLTLFGAMEWAYLGLWDLLAMKQYRNPLYRFFGKKYYWKVMGLALLGSEYVKNK